MFINLALALGIITSAFIEPVFATEEAIKVNTKKTLIKSGEVKIIDKVENPLLVKDGVLQLELLDSNIDKSLSIKDIKLRILQRELVLKNYIEQNMVIGNSNDKFNSTLINIKITYKDKEKVFKFIKTNDLVNYIKKAHLTMKPNEIMILKNDYKKVSMGNIYKGI